MGGNEHHEPFKALAPISWDEVPQDDLPGFLDTIFAQAQVVSESIPAPVSAAAVAAAPAPTGRARAKTDSAVSNQDITKSLPGQPSPMAMAQAQQLRKDWKDSKINPKDNPLGISVYKLASRDGRGAWFARRSMHEGLDFDRWRTAMSMEFTESMKVQGDPGSGSIRGIGADRRVELHEIGDDTKLQVFQLSAQFPGPTSPRDFITLLLTTSSEHTPPGYSRPLRQYMVVSKPCDHPECPQRPGIIRGQYESVELIREIPLDHLGPKRSLSSTDLGADDRVNHHSRQPSTAGADGPALAIEWLMVTRSDPGGSVPRFMIEKGTPPGIVGDAGKFLKWANNYSPDDSRPIAEEPNESGNGLTSDEGHTKSEVVLPKTVDRNISEHGEVHDDGTYTENIPSSTGLYGIITGAFGAASAVVASGLRRQWTGGAGDSFSTAGSSSDSATVHDEDEAGMASETSSLRSFASALEKSVTMDDHAEGAESIAESQRSLSSDPVSSTTTKQPADKELKKLQERRRKIEEKAQKMQERVEQKRTGDKDKDATALAKAREKHERDIAKQEARYQRELQKLEQKRESDKRKADERRRKAMEREEKSNLALELERTRVERDMARKEIELLAHQVGELQSQNTMLVAQLGKAGINVAELVSSPKPFIRSN